MSQSSQESWREYRSRLLTETSQFIEWGLRHPHLVRWIPAKPMGEGGFPRQVADWFWQAMLSDGAGRIGRWRDRLLRAGAFLRGSR